MAASAKDRTAARGRRPIQALAIESPDVVRRRGFRASGSNNDVAMLDIVNGLCHTGLLMTNLTFNEREPRWGHDTTAG